VTEYLVTFSTSTKKELRDLSADVVARVFPRIRELAANPRPVGAKKLHGYRDRWRIRVGEHRVGRGQSGGRHSDCPSQGSVQSVAATLGKPMGIFDLFSKRQKKLRGEMPDIYVYDEIPQPLKVQIIHIWRETLGDEEAYSDRYNRGTQKAYQLIVDILCREYGVFFLPGGKGHYERNYLQELADFLLQEQDAERSLDAIELSFRAIDKLTRDYEHLKRGNASAFADDAIAELNTRFREHGVGYAFDNGEIIRVDSQLLHAEVVKPALALLREPAYSGAQEEFLKAHEHYRHGRTKEALTECLKALESVMKSICSKRNWTYAPHATAKALLDVLFEKGLIPLFWSSHFSGLRSTLEAGVPTGRNRLGGHGQGPEVVTVPQYLVSYVLHMTGSAIVFLVEAEKVLP
jgi:hypothetical protein